MLEFFHNLGLPIDASAHGKDLDALMVYVHWVMLVLFVGWGLFFAYTLWKFRASNHVKADHDGVKSHASSYVEISVIIIEFVLLIGFSIPLWAHHVEGFPNKDEEDGEVDELQSHLLPKVDLMREIDLQQKRASGSQSTGGR